jgi:hypothetical protein
MNPRIGLFLPVFLFLLKPLPVWAEAGSLFMYTKAPGCWIKQYHEDGFKYVEDSNYNNKQVYAKYVKDFPQYMSFKGEGGLLMAPSSCMTSLSSSLLSEKPSSSNYAPRNNSRKNYFIELGGGMVNVASKNPTFDWEQFVGVEDDTNITIDSISSVEAGKYKTKNSLEATFGYNEIDYYLLFKIRHFTANKLESPKVNLSNGLQVILPNSTISDKVTNLSIGAKWISSEKHFVNPFLTLSGGLSFIDSEINFFNSLRQKFNSTGFLAQAEVGFEFSFSNSFGFIAKGGYELLSHSEFKLNGSETTDDQGATKYQGFKTKMNYSNSYASAGLIVYF